MNVLMNDSKSEGRTEQMNDGTGKDGMKGGMKERGSEWRDAEDIDH